MSMTWDVLLICAWDDRSTVESLRPRIIGKGGPDASNLKRLDDEQAGGSRALLLDVWAGCVNYLDEDSLRTAVEEAQWRRPQLVVLLIRWEEDPRPRLWRLEDGKLVRVTDDPMEDEL